MNDNRALTRSNPQAAEIAPGFDPTNVPPEIMQLAVALWASLGQDGGGISQADALKAAIHAQRTGEVFGRDSYIGTTGRVKGQILEGYRAIQARVETPYIVKYRPLTTQEAADNEIKPSMRALICEVSVLDVWRRAQRMNVPYEPVRGLGILTAADMRTSDGREKDPPTGKTWRWVLEKRARKDALRQLPAWARDPYDWNEGDTEEDNAQTRQVAAAEAAAVEQVRQFQQLPPEQQQAKLAANVTAMRGPQTADPLGIDDTPPPASHSLTADTVGNGQALDAIPGAQDETRITDKQRREMFAVATELYGREQLDQFREWIHEQYQVETTNALAMRQGAEIIAKLRAALHPQPE